MLFHVISSSARMLVYVAYYGDWTKAILGVFSSLTKAKDAVQSSTLMHTRSPHVVKLRVNARLPCGCLLCNEAMDNGTHEGSLSKTLWVHYSDYDGFNDRPDYTTGITEVKDSAPTDNDAWQHVVQVQLDEKRTRPAECFECAHCRELQERAEKDREWELQRAMAGLEQAEQRLQRLKV
jgi:hypothetical protein